VDKLLTKLQVAKQTMKERREVAIRRLLSGALSIPTFAQQTMQMSGPDH
jgi:hypothetical protein